MEIQQVYEELEKEINQLEKEGYEFLPMDENNDERIRTPYGRIFTMNDLERFMNSKEKLKFGNKRQIVLLNACKYLKLIVLLNACKYLKLLEEAYPNSASKSPPS